MADDELTPDELLARMRAEFDQTMAGMSAIAQAMWALFTQFLAEGATETQALRLVESWLRVGIGMGSSDDEGR